MVHLMYSLPSFKEPNLVTSRDLNKQFHLKSVMLFRHQQVQSLNWPFWKEDTRQSGFDDASKGDIVLDTK